MVVFKSRKSKKFKKLRKQRKNKTKHTKYKHRRYTLKQPKRKPYKKTRSYYNARKRLGGAGESEPPPTPPTHAPPSPALGIYEGITQGPNFLLPPPPQLNFLDLRPSPPQSQQQPGPQVPTSIMSHQNEVNFSIAYFVSFFVLLCLCIKTVNIVRFFLNRRPGVQATLAHVRETELQTRQAPFATMDITQLSALVAQRGLPVNGNRNELETLLTLYNERYQSYSSINIDEIRVLLTVFGESIEGTKPILVDRLVRASLNLNTNIDPYLMAGGDYTLSPLLDTILRLSNKELNPVHLAYALKYYVTFLVGTDYDRVAYLLININHDKNFDKNFEELITIIAEGLGMTYSEQPVQPNPYKILVKVVGESKTTKINDILQNYSYNPNLNATMKDIKFFHLKYERLYAYLSRSFESSNNNKIKDLKNAFKLINALNSKKQS